MKRRVRSGNWRGINAFVEEFKPEKAIVVTAENDRRRIGSIEVIPYTEFISQLNEGSLI